MSEVTLVTSLGTIEDPLTVGTDPMRYEGPNWLDPELKVVAQFHNINPPIRPISFFIREGSTVRLPPQGTQTRFHLKEIN